MKRLINYLLDKYYKKTWEFKKHKELKQEMYNIFKNSGHKIFYSCIESKNNNLVAKAITFFSGKYSHVFPMLYSENMRNEFTALEWKRIVKNWTSYYGMSENEADEKLRRCKVLILASADENGMNYPDYSSYHGRAQVIRAASIDSESKINKIKKFLVSKKIMNSIYDFTGLAFWWLNKICDQEDAYYCSELTYDAFSQIGIKVAKEQKPSPTQINDYAKDRIIFEIK